MVAPNPNAEVDTGAVDDPNVFVVDPNPKDPVVEVPAAGAPPKPPPNVGATAFVGAPNVGAAALQREQFIMTFFHILISRVFPTLNSISYYFEMEF